MNIRMKIILVVLPLIITTLLLAGISSFLSATTGITRIAREFLDFKSSELKKYAESQWALLVENAFTERAEYVAATQQAIEDYAKSIIRSDTELILALSDQSEVMMNTGEVTLEAQEKTELLPIIEQRSEDLINPTVGGSGRVAKGFYFEPFQWYFLVTEERATFYREVNQITFQTGIILSAALAVSLIMLLFFARYLTRPLIKVVSTMRDIISSNDLSERVLVEYRDEIGQLAHTFNIMIGELEKAYNQIKSYAFKAVLAQKKEQKIRNIFQKYVPRDVIDRFFQNPESMLVGENRMLSVLFSDIRDFTTISESLMPEDLINSLNRYFSVMVDIILNRNGVVDKYMGDAIMAFFGAPVRHTDDALQSVLAGIEMTEALDEFNAHQRKISKPEFKIGVGINYGDVTVGNIGTEKKMDYTVIGDMVNLASRCEGLTKIYKQPLIITESLQAEVKEKLPFRLLDTVAVKGKTKGVEIFAVRKSLTDLEKRAWETHNTAMKLYYERNFQKAGALFKEIREILGQDHIATLLLRRCLDHIKQPPPENWDGVEVIEVK
jgi:class 3 adenylate cyclase/HAMP domain-containing protein